MRPCGLNDAPLTPSPPDVSQLRHANASLHYDWLLSGDDDTIFLRDNVERFVAGLDPDVPYHFSDDFPLGSTGRANPLACVLPGAVSTQGAGGCITTPPAAPCTRAVVRNNTCLADKTVDVPQGGPCDQPGGVTLYGPHSRVSAGGPVWGCAPTLPSVCVRMTPSLSADGQSGILTSRGLARTISEADFRDCEWCAPDRHQLTHSRFLKRCNSSRFECKGGGDTRLGECFFAFAANRQGIAPTLPFADPEFRIFGHDLQDLMIHADTVNEGRHCDSRCRFVLGNVLSTDIHGASVAVYADACRQFSDKYARAKRILRRATGDDGVHLPDGVA